MTTDDSCGTAPPAAAVPLHIAADGYMSDNVIWLTAGENEAVVTLRPAVHVCLDAVDARTGEPLPRFRVEIGRRDPETNGYRWSPRMGRSPPRKFEATLEARDGPFHFRVSADGYAPVRILVPSVRTDLRKTIRLEKLPDRPAARR